MKALKKIWQGLKSVAILFSPRPSASYGQYLSDTVQYHH